MSGFVGTILLQPHTESTSCADQKFWKKAERLTPSTVTSKISLNTKCFVIVTSIALHKICLCEYKIQ